MAKAVPTIPITRIILDEEIYPRGAVYPKRVTMFAENIRDGFKIDPIEVEIRPEYGSKNPSPQDQALVMPRGDLLCWNFNGLWGDRVME